MRARRSTEPASLWHRADARLEAGKRGGGEAQGSGGTVVSKTDGSAVQLSSQKALNELFDRIDADKPKREDLDACRKALRGKMNAILLPHQEEGVAWILLPHQEVRE